MQTVSEINVRDCSLLLGPGGVGSPEWANRALFARDGWTEAGCMEAERVEVLIRPAIEFRGRWLYPVLLRHPDFVWHQPFYRSSGQTMPVASPAGSIWPIAGVCTSGYCQARGYESTETGRIIAHFYNPKSAHWVLHCQDRTRIWPFLLRLAEHVRAQHSAMEHLAAA